jgi:hypothetical protein
LEDQKYNSTSGLPQLDELTLLEAMTLGKESTMRNIAGHHSRKIHYVGAAMIVIVAISASAFFSSGVVGQSQSQGRFTPPVDAKGSLHVPSNYRSAFEYLGSWAVAKDSGPGSAELHEVYASPGTVAAFRQTGQFADGATLVKEVIEASTGNMTTGTVSHADKLKGWFVMVKDRKNAHPGNKLWGDGWGWSWFDAGKPLKTTSTDYKADCLSCHVPAQNTDWIYIQGYTPLRR